VPLQSNGASYKERKEEQMSVATQRAEKENYCNKRMDTWLDSVLFWKKKVHGIQFLIHVHKTGNGEAHTTAFIVKTFRHLLHDGLG
jgi:hypothetical protein